MKKFLTLSALAAFAAIASFGQTILTPTTLSAAVTKAKQLQIVVASATGITAPTQTTSVDLYIDKELMLVEAVSGTTVTVSRGQGGTTATTHASGALVFASSPNNFFTGSADNAGIGGSPVQAGGSCTRTNLLVLPSIDVETGVISDCLGGVWVNGVGTQITNTEYRLSFPDPGVTAYTSINTNGTAVGATTLYCTAFELPYNKLLTGLAFINGTTVTNDHRYSILYDSSGIALANGALTGVTTATASVYQAFAFTAKYFAVGPATYYGCFQDSVGSDTVRMLVTGAQDNRLTKGQTGATFGTVPALTVPTAFTTAVGPYLYAY